MQGKGVNEWILTGQGTVEVKRLLFLFPVDNCSVWRQDTEVSYCKATINPDFSKRNLNSILFSLKGEVTDV
jgi:hypothetical protein